MKKWLQQDLNQIRNILVALKKAKYEVQGEEILAFGQAVRWISMLHDEVANSLKPLPSAGLVANPAQIKKEKPAKKGRK